MSCDDLLSRWDDGDRSPEVAQHVASCPECSALLGVEARVKAWRLEARSEEAFVGRLRARLAPAGRPWVRMAAAAAVLLAVAAAWFARNGRGVDGAGSGGVEPPGGTARLTPPPAPAPFRQRLLEAAAGIGREEFLAGVRQGVERARLVGALRSEDAEERAAAVRVAGLARDRALAAELAALAAQGDREAIAALGAIGGVEAVAVLAALGGDPGKRPAVEAALAATGRPEAAEALAALGAWDNAEAWRTLGDVAAPALAARIRAGGEAQKPALAAAGWSRAAGVVPEVAKLLARPETRAAAAAALEAIGHPKALDALARAATGEADAVASVLRSPAGRLALERRLADARLKPAERARAARTLGVLGDAGAVPALAKALEATDARAEAIEALARLKSDAAVPALAALLGDRKSRAAAADALGRIGSPEAIPHLEAAARRDRDFQDDAVRAVATIESPRAVPMLLAALGDRRSAQTAIAALARLKDRRAIAPLIGALEGEFSRDAQAALEAITGEKLPARKADWVRWLRSRPKEGASLDHWNA